MKTLFTLILILFSIQGFSQSIYDSDFFKRDGRPLIVTCSADSVVEGFQINGKYSVGCHGNFGSGDVKIESSQDNTNWIQLNPVTYSSDTTVNVELSGWFRFELQNSTSPDVDLTINKIK